MGTKAEADDDEGGNVGIAVDLWLVLLVATVVLLGASKVRL